MLPLTACPTPDFRAAPRRLPSALIAAFALCALAGCGGGGGGSDSATSQPTGAPPPASGSPPSAPASAPVPAPPASAPVSAAPASAPTSTPAPTPTPPPAPPSSPTPAPPLAPTPTPAPPPSAPAPAPAPAGPTYLVGSAMPLPAGATRVATLAAVPWGTLPAGSLVLVSPGSYSGAMTVTSTGTAASPIVVTAFDPANPPTLALSVDFQGAAYVQVSHLVVRPPTYAGFIVRNATHDVTIADSTVASASIGVNIVAGAGTGLQVLRNTITDAQSDGIYIESNSDATTRSLVSGNTISRSGQHGIEVRASHYRIEHNVVAASGAAGTGGVSGIHVFRGTPTEDSGADNLVRYNAAYATSDPVAADGNGIEIDQWCDGNAVAYNLVWDNDGAGIIVFDGNGNTVEGNTAYADGVDSGHTHAAALGELIVGASSNGSAASNHVWNNLLASTRAAVPGLYIDTRSLGAGNVVGANLYNNGAAGALVRWGDGSLLATAAAIDAATGAAGSAVDAPSFADTTQPLAGGLRLSAPPSRPGVAPTGDVDFAGAAVQSGWYFLGAYFTSP